MILDSGLVLGHPLWQLMSLSLAISVSAFLLVHDTCTRPPNFRRNKACICNTDINNCQSISHVNSDTVAHMYDISVSSNQDLLVYSDWKSRSVNILSLTTGSLLKPLATGLMRPSQLLFVGNQNRTSRSCSFERPLVEFLKRLLQFEQLRYLIHIVGLNLEHSTDKNTVELEIQINIETRWILIRNTKLKIEQETKTGIRQSQQSQRTLAARSSNAVRGDALKTVKICFQNSTTCHRCCSVLELTCKKRRIGTFEWNGWHAVYPDLYLPL